MKNVLIITHWFPPMTEIGGLRAYGLAKYLPSNGWNPIILTPVLPGEPDPQLRIVQTPTIDIIEQWKKRIGLNPKKSLNEQFQMKRKKDHPSSLDRLVAIPTEIITYPDERKGWYDYAVLAGEKILKTEPIDVILSSSPPAICNIIAKTLAEKHDVPWVADFRDLWSLNHYSSYSPIRSFFEKNLELKTLKHATAITTVSQPLAGKLELLHKKKIFSIRNGFDPSLINPGVKPDPLFKIIHTGRLYQGKRDPAQLLAVIDEMCEKKFISRNDIRIDFFGYPRSEFREEWLQEEIMDNNLSDIVTLHGEVSHETALEEQRKAQILLLLTWANPGDEGVYTGKLFEYLAARRPILSLGYREGGVVKELLDQTRAGEHASDKEALKSIILKAYREYKEFGAVQYQGIDSESLKYSHVEMAKQFAEVFESVASKKR